MPPDCPDPVGPTAVVLLLPEEIADAAVDGFTDLLGGNFCPRRPYNRPKYPNYQDCSDKRTLHVGVPPTWGRRNVGNRIISILELPS